MKTQRELGLEWQDFCHDIRVIWGGKERSIFLYAFHYCIEGPYFTVIFVPAWIVGFILTSIAKLISGRDG